MTRGGHNSASSRVVTLIVGGIVIPLSGWGLGVSLVILGLSYELAASLVFGLFLITLLLYGGLEASWRWFKSFCSKPLRGDPMAQPFGDRPDVSHLAQTSLSHGFDRNHERENFLCPVRKSSPFGLGK